MHRDGLKTPHDHGRESGPFENDKITSYRQDRPTIRIVALDALVCQWREDSQHGQAKPEDLQYDLMLRTGALVQRLNAPPCGLFFGCLATWRVNKAALESPGCGLLISGAHAPGDNVVPAQRSRVCAGLLQHGL